MSECIDTTHLALLILLVHDEERSPMAGFSHNKLILGAFKRGGDARHDTFGTDS